MPTQKLTFPKEDVDDGFRGQRRNMHAYVNMVKCEQKVKGIEFVFLAGGAVAGAFLRYKMAESPLVLGTLPVNVLLINIAGSFILGVFSILAAVWNLDSRYSLLVAIGFCGSFTTMSSFALETNNLLENGQIRNMAINILANVGLSIAAVLAGRSIAGLIVKT